MKITSLDPSGDLHRRVQQFMDSLRNSDSFTLYTSGTTGTPKEVTRELHSSLERKRGGNPTDRFILTFDPARWAGISVLLHCKRFESEIIIPKSLAFADILEAISLYVPTHISLTPTMFRTLLLHDSDRKFQSNAFTQITFGGEAAVQSVLSSAHKLWPDARITHTYASTEHGDICAVSDGLEGFPACKFKDFSFSWDNEIGELVIDGHHTGDLWKLVDGRYNFVGRKEEIINVGGNKVSPLLIEETAIACGAIAARVYAEPSPLMGSLVALDYVGTIDKIELLKAMRSKLPKYACPSVITQRPQLEMTKAGKLRRL